MTPIKGGSANRTLRALGCSPTLRGLDGQVQLHISEVLIVEPYQLNIEDKDRQFAGLLASLKDFSYVDGDKVNPSEIIDNPQISLYCLDDIGKRAIFVELPHGTDLTKAPFVYRTQHEQALRLIAVPYKTFIGLANRLPEIDQPIFIHMSGRSGSTLLSHAFNESKIVASLAEPDVATQFVHLRAAGNQEPELRSDRYPIY